jgi:hypothetical protein
MSCSDDFSQNPHSDENLKEMLLLIVFRFIIDRLWIKEKPGHALRLTMLKEKSYPELEPGDIEIPGR